MTTHPSMNDLFGLLDKWRHFPAFPLEPRSEVLFALFLPTIMESCIGVKINPLVIPQFPLKKEGNNQSNNVDFFALSEDGKCGYLIELKTDMRSRRGNQDKYLDKAIEKNLHAKLCDYKKILKSATDDKYARQKYYHMSKSLSRLRLIELPSELESTIYPHMSGGVDRFRVRKLIDDICILKSPLLEVVYVQPYQSKEDKCDDNRFHYIYFDELANIVETHGDMGGLFAGYLRKWTTDPATHPPR
ncbi:MAG: hypothetical protein OXD31_18205 [Chloroflexi bacterium]|nr:hypothetical protein [Chloroflexota bacterium]